MIPFGERLQEQRGIKKWSQAQLAERIGISASQVANYELGRRLPSLQVVIDTARVLGVTADYLLGLSDEQAQWLDISDLSPEEAEAIHAVIASYRSSHKRKA